MATGTVKWFNDAKGYGFITLAEGAEVQFEAVDGAKGLEAKSVVAV